MSRSGLSLRSLLFGRRRPRLKPLRTRRILGRRPLHEMLEAREVLSATGFAGNECAPVLDLSGISESALIATSGQQFTLDLPGAGATLTDENADGTPTGDTLRWLADPDTGPDFPVDATMSVDGQLVWDVPTVNEPTEVTITVIGIDAGTPALADAGRLTITINPVNTPPDLVDPADIEVNAGGPIAPITVVANDAEGDNITFAIDDVMIVGGDSVPVADRGDIAIDPTTGEFTWTPPAALIPEGQRTVEIDVTLTATDDGVPAQSDAETFRVTLHVANEAPQLASVGPQTIAIGTEMEVVVSATDSELDTLTFILTGNSPSGATITDNGDRTATVRFTPTADDFANAAGGVIQFGVIVVDDGFLPLSDTEFFGLTEANVAPVITSTLDDLQVPLGTDITLQVNFSDANAGQTLVATTGAQTPSGVLLTPNATGALLTWTPTIDDAGENIIEVIVTDDGTPVESATASFTVTVETPPALDPIADQTGLEGVPLSLNVSATDANTGETFAFALDQASIDAGITIDQAVAGSGEATISWTPAAATTTPQAVTVTVTDSFNLTDSVTFNIDVAEATPPTVANAADLEMLFVTPKETFTFVFSEAMGVSALDASNYVLTFNGGPQDGVEIPLSTTVVASNGDTTYELSTGGAGLAPGFYRFDLSTSLLDAQTEPLVGQTAFVFQVAAS